MSFLTAEQVRERYERAKAEDEGFSDVLDDLYKYVLPFRNSKSHGGRNNRRSAFQYMIDSTAMTSTLFAAGKLQNLLAPPYQQFFSFEPGAFYNGDPKAFGEAFEGDEKIIHALLNTDLQHTAGHELFIDLMGGTGDMLVMRGNNRNFIHYLTIPTDEVIHEDGPSGLQEGWHWPRRIKPDRIPSIWKGATVPTVLKERADAQGRVKIVQSTIYDPDDDVHRHYVWSPDLDRDDAVFHRSATIYSVWVSPRYFKLPGVGRGIGPAMLALPTTRTLNKAAELVLKNAAYAMLGLWMVRDDGVTNSAMNNLVPGGKVLVRNTGGSRGPDISPLETPRNFDVSQFVMSDLRDDVKSVLMDRGLPTETDAVRSAYEISARIQKEMDMFTGAFARISREYVVALVQRVMEIANGSQLLTLEAPVNKFMLEIKVTSALAAAQNMEEVTRVTQWMSLLDGVNVQQQHIMGVKIEDAAQWIGHRMGVPRELIMSEMERGQAQGLIGQMLAADNQQPQAA